LKKSVEKDRKNVMIYLQVYLNVASLRLNGILVVV